MGRDRDDMPADPQWADDDWGDDSDDRTDPVDWQTDGEVRS